MKKKIVILAMCTVLGTMFAACKNATTAGKDSIPTPETGNITGSATLTPSATETPIPTKVPLSVTDYEYTVTKTSLPETYFGISIGKVTDKEVDDYVDEILEGNAALVEQDRLAKLGDIVNIDYTGYENDVPFENGADTGFDLELGSNRFIDGFEEGLVGAKKGETIKIPLTFPNDYYEPLMAGKNVVFEVKVNSISAYVRPDYTDEFVSGLTNGEKKTIPEFRTYLAELLQEEKQYNGVLEYLVKNSKFDYINEKYITESVDETRNYYTAYAIQCGLDLDSFLLYGGITDGTAFFKELENQMRDTELQRMALYSVAKKENITIVEEDFMTYAGDMAASNSLTTEEFLEQNGRKEIENSYLMEKALELLIDNTIIAE